MKGEWHFGNGYCTIVTDNNTIAYADSVASGQFIVARHNAALREAVEAEREECARIAESDWERPARGVASEIRARSNEDQAG